MDMTTKATGTINLAITGMTCGHCVQAVTKALSAVPEIKVRSVALGLAAIDSSDGGAAEHAIAALDRAGYPAKAVTDDVARALGARVNEAGAGSSGGCCGGA